MGIGGFILPVLRNPWRILINMFTNVLASLLWIWCVELVRGEIKKG